MGEMNGRANCQSFKEKYVMFGYTFMEQALMTNIFPWKPDTNSDAEGVDVNNSGGNTSTRRRPFNQCEKINTI
jgi:hypothetical protein